MLANDAADDLVRLCATVIEPKLIFAGSKPDPLTQGDGGRFVVRAEMVRQWTQTWLPQFEAARKSCPWARDQIVALRIALANAIVRGAAGDIDRVEPARIALECAARESEWPAAATPRCDEPTGDQQSARPRAKKRNTTRGDADAAILSALCAHHKFQDRSCGNWEPIGGNDLGKLARCAAGSVTGFWKRRYGSDDRDGTYEDYRRSCVNQTLAFELSLWRGELPAKDVLQLVEDRRREDDD
jgi:hypothetical protein